MLNIVINRRNIAAQGRRHMPNAGFLPSLPLPTAGENGFGGMGSYCPPSGPSKLNITAARKPNPVGKVFLSFVTDPGLENSSGRAFLFRKLQMKCLTSPKFLFWF